MDKFVQVDRQDDGLMVRSSFHLMSYLTDEAFRAVEKVIDIADTRDEPNEFGQRGIGSFLDQIGLLQQHLQVFRMKTPFEIFRTLRRPTPNDDYDHILFHTESDSKTTVEIRAGASTQVDIRAHPSKV